MTERYRPSPIMVNYSLVQCLTGFPGGTEVKNSPAKAGDARDSDLIPGAGRSPAGRNGSPLQYSCLRNPRTGEPGRLLSWGSQEMDMT